VKEIEESINAGLFLIEIPWNIYMFEYLPAEDKWIVNDKSDFNKTIKEAPQNYKNVIIDKFLQYIQYHLSSGYQTFLTDESRNPYPKFYH
jgi:isoleucyl-tRNA synthetase